LAELERCVPASGADGLLRAMQFAARLGYDVCDATAATHGWAWPKQLARRVREILEQGPNLETDAAS
jgi:hypothetical protein